MSKIAVAGNASGTGTLTIAAPNTNSDQTITLPDATGSFVTADGSGNITLSSGTANGVTYLNGSKILTSGSALTFDGTTLAVTGRLFNGSASSFGASTWAMSLGNGGVSANYFKAGTTYFQNDSGTQIAQLDSTGLGIGTSSPSNNLTISSGSSTTVGINSGATGETNLEFRNVGSIKGIIQYQNSSNVMRFFTNAGERMRLDSAGNVGIGTTSPGSRLQVSGSANMAYFYDGSTSDFQIQTVSSRSEIGSTTNTPLSFKTNNTERARIDSSGNVGIGTTSPTSGYMLDVSGKINTQNRYAVNGKDTIAREDSNKNVIIGDAAGIAGSYVTFRTVNTERARIDSTGNLLVGTTSSFGTGEGFCGFANGTAALRLKRGADYGATARFYNFGGSEVGSITVNASSTSYNTSSDYRLKEDWQPMTGASERVKALNPVNFAWKADGSRVDGFLAHEAQAVVPEAVTGTKDAVDADGNPDYQGIDQSKLVPLLTAALQEALARIETLEADVATLKGAA